MEQGFLFRYGFSAILLSVCCIFLYISYDLFLKAKVLRKRLQKQGIDGPTPSLMLGNLPDIQKISSVELPSNTSSYNLDVSPSFDCCSILLPHISQWTKQYGKTFSFALGKVQILYTIDAEWVRQISLCKSLDLGKPDYLQKDRGPLLGKGILTTSRHVWAHQRKTIAPTLYVDKVKDMLSTVLESGNSLIKSWEKLIEVEGGIADIGVDDYVKNFASSVISSIMFGRNYNETTDLFSKYRAIMRASGSPTVLDGRPFYRLFPTAKNRKQWRLEKEIYSMIKRAAKLCSMSEGETMLNTLVKGAKHGELRPSTPEQFVVDNCKELCIVGMEVAGTTAIWGLMLLASHPEWQSRARAEVLEVCGGQMPDAEKLGKMRVLKMIIQEILRLYPALGFTVREALEDVNIGKVCIPKGVNLWIWPIALHRDQELWGPDALEFKPERFANGIPGACKIPQAYIPFGIGPRTCPGMNLGMLELKVLFALILSNFSFSLSPSYQHVPKFNVLLEPKYGVNLLVRKL